MRCVIARRASGSVRRLLFVEEGIDRLGGIGGAQLGDQIVIAQHAGDTRQSLEMISARALRRKQQEHEIDRPGNVGRR